MHVTTRLTLFFANYGYHPEMHFKPPKQARFRSEKAADELGKLQTARDRDRLRGSILEAQERQTRYAGGKEMTFEVGDKVWLSAKHIQTVRASEKLDYKRLDPFKVTKVINRNAYRLELPYSMKVHNVFHVSLLDRYIGPVPDQQPSDPPLAIPPRAQMMRNGKSNESSIHASGTEGCGIWCGGLITTTNTSWEPAENLENASEVVADFHRDNPAKPRA
jgi:hypothetical protein